MSDISTSETTPTEYVKTKAPKTKRIRASTIHPAGLTQDEYGEVKGYTATFIVNGKASTKPCTVDVYRHVSGNKLHRKIHDDFLVYIAKSNCIAICDTISYYISVYFLSV